MKQTPPHWKVGAPPPVIDKRNTQLEGLPIIDGKLPLVLHIKSCDIKGSKKSDAANCAAARALKRELGSECRVYLTRTYVKVGKKWQRYLTPQSISREIVAFDRGAPFEPGEYTLVPPTASQKLGAKRPGGPMRKKISSSRPRHVTASVRQMK